MPTIISHPAVLLALRPGFPLSPYLYVWGAICSIIPDLDVIGFAFGIRYGDLLGHRGFTHSLFFAALVATVSTLVIQQREVRVRIFFFLFLCTASHGILDAFTDGGLGIAFFSPFSNERYFFPWQPLAVSPIGMGNFLSGPALDVLGSEFIFLWLPCAIVFLTGTMLHHLRMK